MLESQLGHNKEAIVNEAIMKVANEVGSIVTSRIENMSDERKAYWLTRYLIADNLSIFVDQIIDNLKRLRSSD